MHKAQQSFLAMNTVISNTVCGGRAEQAAAAAHRETQRLERLFSRFIQCSDIARLNQSAGGKGIRLSPETFEALATGLECSQNTGGCFDMTVGPLVRLWNASPNIPAREAVDAALALTGYSSLALRRRGRTASLERPGQSVDLGGIGKGYAADRILMVFRKHGVTSAFTDFGGNIAALGVRPDGAPWTVGVRHPKREGALIGALKVADRSVVTSGDDQRAIHGADGKLRSHIIDPRTGMPADSGLLSVTVVAEQSAVADALATALFTAGMEKGAQYLTRYSGSQAVFIDRDASVFITGGLRDCFQAAQGIQTTVL